MTAEDPVEFNLAGINQVQVHEDIGLNFAAALRSLPAPGPEHHPGRRDPRLRDGGDRGQGRAHRPPRALDAAHQRRAEHDQPPDEHGHRAVPRRQLGEPDLRPAPGAPHLRELQGADDPTPPQALVQAGFSRRGRARRSCRSRARGCEKCNNTGYKGRVGLYEVMEITDELARADPRRRVGARAAAQGDRGRHDHAARQRPRARSRTASRRSRKSLRETVAVSASKPRRRHAWPTLHRAAEDDGRDGGVGPAPVDEHAAAGARPRRAACRSSCRR